MPFVWKRPSDAEFPLIYSKFKALSSDGVLGLRAYRIEDIQRDRFDDALEIMRDKHLLDEPMYSSKGVRDDPVALQEMIDNWKNMLEQGVSLICFEEASDEIVAVNLLGVVTEAEFDAPNNVRTKERLCQSLSHKIFLASRKRLERSQRSEEIPETELFQSILALSGRQSFIRGRIIRQRKVSQSRNSR